MKKKVALFQDMYRKRYWFGGYWNNYAWREAFGNPKKLPMNNKEITKTIYDDTLTVMVTLILKPVAPKGVKQHRVFVVCPECCKEVPAGRIHQHTC